MKIEMGPNTTRTDGLNFRVRIYKLRLPLILNHNILVHYNNIINIIFQNLIKEIVFTWYKNKEQRDHLFINACSQKQNENMHKNKFYNN